METIVANESRGFDLSHLTAFVAGIKKAALLRGFFYFKTIA
jgi:hypothetical protein